MKSLKLMLYVILTLIFGCASSSTVISEFDESINFNTYKTFVICVDDLYVDNTNYPSYDNNMVRQLVADAIENEMRNKGYKTNVIKPELQAGFDIVIEEKENTFTNCETMGRYDYWEKCTINTEVYTEESLVVYVSDIDKNQYIWQASITCNLNKSKSNLRQYIKSLIKQLFNAYPKPDKVKTIN